MSASGNEDRRSRKCAPPDWLRRASGWKLALAVLLGCLGLLLVGLVSCRDSAVTVHARSEAIRLSVVGEVLGEWPLGDAWVFTEDSDEGQLLHDAVLLMSHGMSAHAERRGKGPLRIELEAKESPGEIRHAAGQLPLPPRAVLSTPGGDAGSASILPFRGCAVLGDDVAAGVGAVLLEGRVQLAEKFFLRDERYLMASQDLDAGDRVTLRSTSYEHRCLETGQALADGFLRVDWDKLGFEAVAHAVHATACVGRLGSEGYCIEPSPFRRLLYDPLLTVLATVLAIALALPSAVDSTVALLDRRAGR